MNLQPSSSLLIDVKRLYDSPGRDPDFQTILSSTDLRDDTVLAELIEADGRLRIESGKGVDLARYLQAVPDLAQRRDSLDAAIDVVLRAMAGPRPTTQAIESLIGRYPQFTRAIKEAGAMGSAIWSTTGLQARVDAPPPKALPCEFGSRMPDGTQRYQLNRLLGQGAFGQVYLALDRQLSEEGHTALVAIKILATRERSPLARQRMIEEATKVRRINHGNVIMVIDRGVTDHDEDYIVYEFVDGGDLSDLLQQVSTLPVQQAARIMRDIALGVHAAHSAGVIHCDLKPGNIMLTAGGVPKVADFGISVRLKEAANESGKTDGAYSIHAGPIGNLAFVSPEQYRGEDGAFSIPSDIYALGGILYLLVTGVLPNGSTLEQIAQTHSLNGGRTDAPKIRQHCSEADLDLEAICAKTMDPNPAKRYSSAAAFADDLDHWLNFEPIRWTKPSLWRVTRLWRRRKPGLALLSTIMFVMFVVGSGVTTYFMYSDAINRVKFEAEWKFRQRGSTLGNAVMQSLKFMKDEYRFSSEALTAIWVFEHLYGPKVFGMPEMGNEFWHRRIPVTRGLVENLRRDGHEEDMETLLWESALGFWLVNDNQATEAEQLLAQNREKWARKLAPDDPWLSDVRAIELCARIKCCALDRSAFHDDADLEQLALDLNSSIESVASRHKGTPIHFLLLQTKAELYGPKLLNQPKLQEQFASDLQKLKDDDSLKLPSVKNRNSATQPATTQSN